MTSFAHGLGRQSEAVLLAVRREIAGGVFDPAGKLPTEQELCARFGVSRTTVRRATARLVEEKLITVRRRAGMFVSPVSDDSLEARTFGVMGVHGEGFLLKAQNYALDNDCRLDVFYQDEAVWDVRRERQFLKRVQRAKYRLLVALCSPLEPVNTDVLRELAAQGTRVIHVEPYGESLPEQEYLMPDYRKAGYTGAVELQLAGYTRLCYVGFGQSESPWGRLVEAGFAEALELHADGYSRKRAFFDYPRVWSHEAAAASQERVDRWIAGLAPQTGLLCRNAALAEHMLLDLKRRGRRVPDEIGLVCVHAFIAPEASSTAVHALAFDRAALMLQALKNGAENGSRLHELIAPKIRRGDTVRRRMRSTV